MRASNSPGVGEDDDDAYGDYAGDDVHDDGGAGAGGSRHGDGNDDGGRDRRDDGDGVARVRGIPFQARWNQLTSCEG